MTKKEETEEKAASTEGDSSLNKTIAVWALIIIAILVVVKLIVGASGRKSSGVPNSAHEAAVVDLEQKIEVAEKQKELREITGQPAVAPQGRPQGVPAVWVPAGEYQPARSAVVDNTIYLTLEGQREVKLPLSTVEWSQPIGIQTKTVGAVVYTLNLEPHVGFRARVLDDKVPAGEPYREVSIPAGGGLSTSGLRKVSFKGVASGQQMTVAISE